MTAGINVGVEPDEPYPAIACVDAVFGQQTADVISGNMTQIDLFPDLFLACVIVADREGHQLVERHAILAIDVEQRRRNRSQPQTLTHGRHRNEEAGGDIVFGQTGFDQRAESAELVEWVKSETHDILGKGIFFGDASFADDAGNRLILRHPLRPDQQFERTEAAASRRNLEDAGFPAIVIEQRPDIQTLEEGAVVDVLRQVID